MMGKRTDLLPCPCCGGEARMFHPGGFAIVRVSCSRCKLVTRDYVTEAKAIATWNRRAMGPADIMDVAREMAGALKAAYDNMYVQASEEGCMPIEMEIIHDSEKALARAREAGIEVPE